MTKLNLFRTRHPSPCSFWIEVIEDGSGVSEDRDLKGKVTRRTG
jgi:hypothetical protein